MHLPVSSAPVERRALVIGASLAGMRAAEGLRLGGHDGPITVVGAERHMPYDRPPLSKQLLTGKADSESVRLHTTDDLDVEWMLSTTAVRLDADNRTVTVEPLGANGSGRESLHYDLLVIATGAEPRILHGFEVATGAFYLRTLDDAVALRGALAHSEKAIVVGGGFIGLEVAASAFELGVSVTVLEALPVPLSRAIGVQMGDAIADLHRRRGVQIRTGVAVEGIVGSSAVEGVRLVDGDVLPAEVVVVGVGVTPVTGWLESSGVDLDNGVLCDERLRVLSAGRPLEGVVAAGDVARWSHPRYSIPVRVEHWTNAAEQGAAAADTLLRGDDAPPFQPVPYFWSDQHGVKIQFVGDAGPSDEIVVLEGSPEEERFVAAYGRDGMLTAAIGMRRPARVMALQRAIDEGSPFPPPV